MWHIRGSEVFIYKSYSGDIIFDEGFTKPYAAGFKALDQTFYRRLPDHEVCIRGYYCAEREEEAIGKERAEIVQSYILEHDPEIKRPHHISWYAMSMGIYSDYTVEWIFYNPKASGLEALEIIEAANRQHLAEPKWWPSFRIWKWEIPASGGKPLPLPHVEYTPTGEVIAWRFLAGPPLIR